MLAFESQSTGFKCEHWTQLFNPWNKDLKLSDLKTSDSHIQLMELQPQSIKLRFHHFRFCFCSPSRSTHGTILGSGPGTRWITGLTSSPRISSSTIITFNSVGSGTRI